MRPRLALLLVLALTATRAHAVELELGWSARGAWESNVFQTSDDEESDFSVLTGPEVRLRERTRALNLDAGYRVLYEDFLQLDGIGSFQHYLNSNGTWRPTDRDTFSFAQYFAHTENLIQLADVGATGLVSGVVQDREPISWNTVNGKYRRQLTPLWQLGLEASNTATWYDRPTQSDSLSSTGSIDTIRALSPRQSIGAGFSASRQDFDDTELTNGNGTTFLQVYGIWNYEVTPTISFALSAGPRLARPDDLEDTGRAPANPVRGTFVVSPSGCPAFSPGVVRLTESCQLAAPVRVNASSIPIGEFDFLEGREQPDENLGVFGQVSLVKRWRTVTTTLTYQRSASASSGLATSTDLDVLMLRTEWRPRRAWRIAGLATWERQVSISELPSNELLLSSTPVTLFVDAQGRLVDGPVAGGQTITNAAQTVGLRTAELVDDAIDIRTTRVELRVHRDLTPRLTVGGMATWWREESHGELQADPITDVRVELSLTWRLAPIDL